MRWLVGSLSALLMCVASARAEDAKLPSDLAVVPADGLGFVHIRAAELWKSEVMKDYREIVLNAGDDALKAFDRRFVPALSSLERITLFAYAPDFQQAPSVFFSVRFAKAFDTAAFLRNSMPKAAPRQEGARTVYLDPQAGMEVSVLDEQTLLVGFEGGMSRLFKSGPAATGALSEPLQLAARSTSIVGALNTGSFPAEAVQSLPPQVQPLALTKLVTFGLEFNKDPRFNLKLHYGSPEQAAEANKALRNLCQMGIAYGAELRKEGMKLIVGDGKSNGLSEMPFAAVGLFMMGGVKTYEDFLKNPPVALEGTSLAVSLGLPTTQSAMMTTYAAAIGFLLPAVQKTREAAARAQSQNNLKQIALAMHNYESAYGHFPSAAVLDKKGKALLSWRVTILPYIEQDALYREFKLDEPWDSEHNKKLIPKMPKIYTLASAPVQTPGETYYRIFYGKEAAFDWVKGRSIISITDGTSNTLMCVEGGDSVPWTKPDDYEYDAKKPLPRMGDFGRGGFNAALCDGSVRFIRTTIDPKTLRALITANGGEVFSIE